MKVFSLRMGMSSFLVRANLEFLFLLVTRVVVLVDTLFGEVFFRVMMVVFVLLWE